MAYKVQIGVVDDEKHGRDYLALLLANEFPDISVAFIATGMEEAACMLENIKPDIILLDIELGDGTAFDLLQKTGKLPAQIIFITAYDHYAIQAIKNNAIDFVLKPVEVQEFVLAINKAINNINQRQLLLKETKKPTISLPIRNGLKIVAISDIIRCEADSNYTRIYLKDKSKYMLSKTLQELELQLSPYLFFRVHHKHLINMEHFIEFRKGTNGQVLLSDGSLIDVSTRRKSDFMNFIKKIN